LEKVPEQAKTSEKRPHFDTRAFEPHRKSEKTRGFSGFGDNKI
jgi:hypothetical protein